jgi:DNA-binding SARP family transcriptional activator
MLSVRMLGVLSVSLDGERLPEELGPTGRLLSGYLFEFVGRVHRRERLADQFWGHLDPDRARAALNTALWRLRKLLARDPKSLGGQNLRSYGSEVVLEPASWLAIDTHRFEAAVKEVLDPRSGQDGAARLAVLEAAVESYVGPFLDGDDADWVLEERERLHSLFVRMASELVCSYGAAERYDEAIAAARRIIAADPFRESIFRKLAILLVLNGQRAEALRHYERWSALFRRDLGIDPMPQTLRLIEEIRSGQICERLDAVKMQCFSCAGAAAKNTGREPHSQGDRSVRARVSIADQRGPAAPPPTKIERQARRANPLG